MTDSSSSQPPGWYYAQGDPVGTQRYWDGTQWVGGPQAVAGAVAQGAYGGAVQGAGAAASWGTRALAFLIDWGIGVAIIIVGLILAAILGAISDALGAIMIAVAYLGVFGYAIWNLVVRQGQTGQTIGKAQQNIKLIADATHQPVGAGMAFVRMLLGSIINWVCYIDYLWPLWDQDKKRLSDKILNFSVVQA